MKARTNPKLFIIIGFLAFKCTPSLLGIGKSCPSIAPIYDFNYQRYTGRWYEIMTNQDSRFFNIRCNQLDVVHSAEFTMQANFTGLIGASNTYSMVTMLLQVDPLIPNLFIFNYDNNPYIIIKTMYAILSTDYTTYSVNLECGESGKQTVFVYSRNISFEVDSTLSLQITSLLNCADRSTQQIGWIKSNQINCATPPEINQTHDTTNALVYINSNKSKRLMSHNHRTRTS